MNLQARYDLEVENDRHKPRPTPFPATVFGQVVAGQEVVDRIEQGDRILRLP